MTYRQQMIADAAENRARYLGYLEHARDYYLSKRAFLGPDELASRNGWVSHYTRLIEQIEGKSDG